MTPSMLLSYTTSECCSYATVKETPPLNERFHGGANVMPKTAADDSLHLHPLLIHAYYRQHVEAHARNIFHMVSK